MGQQVDDEAEDPVGSPKAARANVRRFYDTFGWKKDDSGRYLDGATADDWRPVAAWYRKACNRRVGAFIAPRGRFLLDAASGAVQFDEYADYSRNYEHHVCVDFSPLALREARARLGPKALVVQADVTALPFRSDCFDAVVSLHTVYHVPAAEQLQAFTELYRVLRPERTGAVVYAHVRHVGHPLPKRVADGLLKKPGFERKLRPTSRPKDPPGIYYFPLPLWEIVEGLRSRGMGACVRTWRSISVSFGQLVIPNNPLGSALFRLIYAIEELLPSWCGWHGNYPLIVLRKAEPPLEGSTR